MELEQLHFFTAPSFYILLLLRNLYLIFFLFPGSEFFQPGQQLRRLTLGILINYQFQVCGLADGQSSHKRLGIYRPVSADQICVAGKPVHFLYKIDNIFGLFKANGNFYHN